MSTSPSFDDVAPPAGDRITMADGTLQVPDRPIIPFIEGDGTGPDIWNAAQPVFDAAVEAAYGSDREIQWMEVYAGGKAQDKFDAKSSISLPACVRSGTFPMCPRRSRIRSSWT
jgi:isocitrate dehydrogenase